MRKLGLGFLTLVVLGLCLTLAKSENAIGPSNLIACNKVAVLEVGASGMQTIIPAVTGQAISICGWNVTNNSTNGTFTFVSGTQTTTPCDTGQRKLSPSFNVSSTSPNADHTGNASQTAPTGAAVCGNPSATTFTAMVWYAQF